MKLVIYMLVFSCAYLSPSAADTIDLPGYHCAFHEDQFDDNADLAFYGEKLEGAFKLVKETKSIADQDLDDIQAKVFATIQKKMLAVTLRFTKNWWVPDESFDLQTELDEIKGDLVAMEGLNFIVREINATQITSLGKYAEIMEQAATNYFYTIQAETIRKFKGHFNGNVVHAVSRAGGIIINDEYRQVLQNVPCEAEKYLNGWFGNPNGCNNKEAKKARENLCANGINQIQIGIDAILDEFKPSFVEVNAAIRDILNQKFVNQLFVHLFTSKPADVAKWEAFFASQPHILAKMYHIRIENACDYEKDKAILFNELNPKTSETEATLNEFLKVWLGHILSHTNVIYSHTAIQHSKAAKTVMNSNHFCEYKDLFMISFPGC